jgi:hypothetical protein
MFRDVNGPQRTVQATLKIAGIGVLVVVLIALVAVAAYREFAAPKPQPKMVADSGYANSERPAISAEEEAYAHSLWPIHAQVKQDAVKMTFAGLAYKMGDIKRAAMKDRVAPLTPRFEQALAAMAKLKPPRAVQVLHDEYSQAIRLYRDASVVMVKMAADGDDRHLMEAQEKTDEASGLTLKVGETLWPGEFKPN